MNKLFVSVLALTLASSSMLLTGCNKENSQGNVDEATSITLTNNSLSMCVGDTFLIGATLSGGNNDTELVYSSTDESVATVNENGFIKALKPGTAEIKAVYGKSIARCKINVELKDNVPTIELKNIADKTDLFLDVHLMISDPKKYIPEFIKSGADLITFHYEAFENGERY